MSGNTIKYSIVAPVYRSGPWLNELVQRIESTMRQIGEPFEVILVNDCSPDDVTWPIIEELCQKFDFLTGIDLLYNVGQFRAVLCGFEHALGEFIITLDDDLQHPPEEIPKLVREMKENPELLCVMGKYEGKKHSFLRNLGSEFVAWIMQKAYNKPKGIKTTSFRILKRSLAETLVHYRTNRPLLGPLIVQTTRKVANVLVEHHPRPHGRSGYGIGRLISATFDSIIHASTVPLRAFASFGFCVAALAFLLAFVYFVRWCLGQIHSPGFTSLILTVSFFSGMILMGIGVLGEYIARIIAEVTGPPKYQIREKKGRCQ